MQGAFVKRQHSFDYDALIDCGKGELFGAEGPQLPMPPMLMFDRITHIYEDGGTYNKGRMVAELDVSPDLWFFGCHFIGDPVMPGCLGLDAMWQLVGFYMGWLGQKGKGRALGAGEVKFSGQVLPTAKCLTYEINVRRVMATRLVLAVADGNVLVDGKLIYEAKGMRVGLFREPSAL
jgi:3-hydroxyacyl-[acyl-carrier protein] dehydratase/trans-2-decenoyl-[acyl-carrier protein] isomerase